jgi:hypothetical protein
MESDRSRPELGVPKKSRAIGQRFAFVRAMFGSSDAHLEHDPSTDSNRQNGTVPDDHPEQPITSRFFKSTGGKQ